MLLALYFETAICELVENWPADVQDVWWAEVFTADAVLQWWGPDTVKDMCRDIVESLDLEDHFKFCLWNSMPWDEIFERLRARFKELQQLSVSADAAPEEEAA